MVLDSLSAGARRERLRRCVLKYKSKPKAKKAEAKDLTEKDLETDLPAIKIVPASPKMRGEKGDEVVGINTQIRREILTKRVLVKGHALLHKRDEDGRCYHHGWACARRTSVVDVLVGKLGIA